MNPQQLAEEMQRLQMEYAANPSPENLAKMQGEMMRLQQEMISMQAAAMDTAFGDDEEEELKKFTEEHPPAPGKAKYLPIGAFLLTINGEPCGTFALIGDKEEWREGISEGWDIAGVEAGREMLKSLLRGRHSRVFDDDYRKFKAGKPHKLDEDSVEAYNDMLETLGEDLPALLSYAKNCKTILAWDLERAGYLARIFAHLGWISEKESFDWLKKTAAQIKESFGCWEEYAVSVMAGRALHFEDADPVIGAACELFGDKKELFDSNPVSGL
ncbi:MAG: DUF1266 domain-containing protein [Treponema sp.]|nr:DUF1266 domain-containing protein [Treponema sp.]